MKVTQQSELTWIYNNKEKMKNSIDKNIIAEQEKLELSLKEELLKDSSEENFQKAYDEIHKFFIEKENVESLYSEELKWIDHLFIKLFGTGNKILDIGSGNGKLAFAMAEKKNEVIGLDISKVAITIAQKRLMKLNKQLQVVFKQGDARNLSFDDNTFDVIVSQDLVEHITEDDFKMHLKEVYRVLKPGGRYFFWTPSALRGGSSHGLHIKEYSVNEMYVILKETEFKYTWYDLRFYKVKLLVRINQSLMSPIIIYENALKKIIRFIPKPIDKFLIPPLFFELRK
jgi:ubiquinone/menaquinone biosynthesis C-methylase UbiE